ncbi:MAG: GTPase HflX, partial [Varibaculum sp.]
PEIIVLNKADLVDALHLRALQSAIGGGIPLSTRTGQGIAQLREAIANALPSPAKPIDYVIPYDQSALVARLHEEGIVDKVEYLENGTHIVGRAGSALAQAILEAAN